MIRFTRNAADGVSPLITAAAAGDTDFWWQGPGGTFVGKQPDIANFPVGDFTLRSSRWDAITAINFSTRKLTKFDMSRALRHMVALYSVAMNNNNLTNDVAQILPYLPAGLHDVALYNAAHVGDVSKWILPASLVSYNVFSMAGIYGDISGWVLPPLLSVLWTHATGVTGDISGWVLPAPFAQTYLSWAGLSYGTGGMFATATRNSSTYHVENNSMLLAEVDRILADCVASGTTGSTLIADGTNASPTDGVNNANRLELVNNRGWTVTVTA